MAVAVALVMAYVQEMLTKRMPAPALETRNFLQQLRADYAGRSQSKELAMYVASPKLKRTGAVLVLHSWWGLNGFFRRLWDRFAAHGFVALAPDLYDGRVADTVADAKKLRAKVTASRREPAYKYLIRMINELRSAAGKWPKEIIRKRSAL